MPIEARPASEDGGVAQVEAFERREAGELFEREVADLGLFEVEVAEFGEAGEVGDLGVRDERVVERDGDYLAAVEGLTSPPTLRTHPATDWGERSLRRW
ncbi:MAG: hypothetical protein R2724_33900 [Bryobacterales bacterium]